MPPTGVAAINISGTTIHTALAIPRQCGSSVPAMSDQKTNTSEIVLGRIEINNH